MSASPLSCYSHRYESFESGQHNLFAWEGKKVVVLSREEKLNGNAMQKILNALDQAYDFYHTCTGREPQLFINVNEKLSIADVPHTCNRQGGGCGYLGLTGIELQNDTFDALYNGVCHRNQFDQTVFYELGRNFWFYNEQYMGDPITTGFAIFMRFISMEFLNLQGAPINNYPFEIFKSAVDGLAALYTATEDYYWENLVAENREISNDFNLDQNDLFASFCFELHRRHPQFVTSVWKESELLSKALSRQGVIDNFFLASCYATQTNLITTFKNWRWKISDLAITQVSHYRMEA